MPVPVLAPGSAGSRTRRRPRRWLRWLLLLGLAGAGLLAKGYWNATRDPVIRTMLEGLGAEVSEVVEPFQPVRGAYHSHGGHGHS